MSIASSNRGQQLGMLRSMARQLSVVSKKTDALNEKYRSSFNQNSQSPVQIDCEKNTVKGKELQRSYINSFLQKYKLKEKIGEGANGCVYKCQHKQNKRLYAAKKFKVEEEQIFELKKLFIYYKQFTCDSIVKYKALYFGEGQRMAYLVMEYINYPSLDQVTLKDQEQLKIIVKEMISAISYLHSKNICHRDIKPENILYDEKRKKIKLIDLGISKQIVLKGMRRQMLTVIGSPFYMAPEVHLGGGYDQRVDCWAMGVTICKLVTGQTPFESEYKAKSISNIKNIETQYDNEQWLQFSPLAKRFVLQLLRPKEKRMTLEEAKSHLWLSKPQRARNRRSSSQEGRIFKEIKHSHTKEEGGQNQEQESLNMQINDFDINKKEYDLSWQEQQFYIPEAQQPDYRSTYTPMTKSANLIHTFSSQFDNLFIS